MKHFLLIFDHKNRVLEATQEFHDGGDAARAYAVAERAAGDRPDVEIVLVGSDSLDTIKRTHGQYFNDVPERRSHYLEAVMG